MGRVIGWLFVIGAATALGFDLYALATKEVFRLTPLGELWFELDAGSLNLAQVVLERHLWPPLWDPGFLTFLLTPACIAFAAIGAILLVLFRTRRR